MSDLRERQLAAKRKYNHSAKGKAARARWKASGKRKPCDERYRASDRSKALAKERQRKWRALNPEKDRERRIESLRKWRENNREAFRIHCRKRRKLEHEAEGFHTAADIKALYIKQRGICLCGADLCNIYHVDHMTPLSRGGTDWPENLQLLCPPCNYSKRNMTMDEWYQSRFTTC